MTTAEAILGILVGVLCIVAARLGEHLDRLKAASQRLSDRQALLAGRIEAVNQRHERNIDKLRGINV